jgi:hypothetical protein
MGRTNETFVFKIAQSHMRERTLLGRELDPEARFQSAALSSAAPQHVAPVLVLCVGGETPQQLKLHR